MIVELDPHPASDQHQNWIISAGSCAPLVRACHVWSTSVNAFVSYPTHRITDRQTDRQTQTDRQNDSQTAVITQLRLGGVKIMGPDQTAATWNGYFRAGTPYTLATKTFDTVDLLESRPCRFTYMSWQRVSHNRSRLRKRPPRWRTR